MCGIMGCVGFGDCVKEVCDGLGFLEYRGYDSSGIAVVNSHRISVVKKKGRVSTLTKSLLSSPIHGSPCIGHTRWATHGAPDDKNAHPFVSNDDKFALVHNGVIENHKSLRSFLVEKGFVFHSDTDSEVIVNLIQYYHKGDTLSAISDTVNALKGSFALAIISAEEPEKIFLAKLNNPLVVGIKNGVGYVCSDYNGISHNLSECVSLSDGTIGFITNKSLSLFTFNLQPLSVEFTSVIHEEKLACDGYSYYMRKEIDEIPDAVSRALSSYYLSFDKSVFFGKKRIVFIGCGTALHAGLVAKRLLREFLPEIDCYAEPSSEFIYSDFPIPDTLFVAISQSGETADTLSAVKKIKSQGGLVYAVCNVPLSSIVQASDGAIFTCAGREIAVASTKAYNCQLAVLTALCLDAIAYFSPLQKNFPQENAVCELLSLPVTLQRVLLCENVVSSIAKKYLSARSVFYLGRGLDYCVACEGSLKLKEISYVHSEAYAGGELKHGTLALIEPNVVVIAVVTQKNLVSKMITAISEVRTRGATVVVITPFADDSLISSCDDVIFIPEVSCFLSPIVSVVPTQLFAYYSAFYRNLDIDKPRNLAKSVTVE